MLLSWGNRDKLLLLSIGILRECEREQAYLVHDMRYRYIGIDDRYRYIDVNKYIDISDW